MKVEALNSSATIFLIGFMACGKSTVGPVLAAKLDRLFIDLDLMIEGAAGCSIAELMAREGEERFRHVETQVLSEIAQSSGIVVAPGGGAITRAENRELMSRHGIMVWLDAPLELCWRRIQGDGTVRPLAPDVETARQRYQQRVPLYQQAMITISVNESQTPDEIAESIIERLQVVPHHHD